ncbi:nuclear transport factor 2 family protein [Williamsia soli]|uniref:nuclear transport factor 2 family protein n=1 Tax=Williamsia soli TaxID=364929 RepID=UPI001A9E6E1D|nr:nuclear transport factor 2 family protein [Williamsia soli]
MSSSSDLLQEDAIRRLIALYAFKLDDRDYSALAAMLHEDCVMAVGSFKQTGRDEMIAAVANMQTQEPGRHLLGPTVVQLGDQGHASAWTDMVGIVPGPDSSQVIAGTWRYHDRLVLGEDGWLFTHRFLHSPAEPLMWGAPSVPTR